MRGPHKSPVFGWKAKPVTEYIFASFLQSRKEIVKIDVVKRVHQYIDRFTKSKDIERGKGSFRKERKETQL